VFFIVIALPIEMVSRLATEALAEQFHPIVKYSGVSAAEEVNRAGRDDGERRERDRALKHHEYFRPGR
jgi:hypothetical protein